MLISWKSYLVTSWQVYDTFRFLISLSDYFPSEAICSNILSYDWQYTYNVAFYNCNKRIDFSALKSKLLSGIFCELSIHFALKYTQCFHSSNCTAIVFIVLEMCFILFRLISKFCSLTLKWFE